MVRARLKCNYDLSAITMDVVKRTNEQANNVVKELGMDRDKRHIVQ